MIPATGCRTSGECQRDRRSPAPWPAHVQSGPRSPASQTPLLAQQGLVQLMPTNPLYADLMRERFSRPLWWATPPAHADSEVMQYFRRLELEAADNKDDNDEETT